MAFSLIFQAVCTAFLCFGAACLYAWNKIQIQIQKSSPAIYSNRNNAAMIDYA